MSSFPNSAYDKWLTTTPADRAHSDTCNCNGCHGFHIVENKVIDNALDAPRDFECCVIELGDIAAKGKICANHPRALVYLDGGCEECEKHPKKGESNAE